MIARLCFIVLGLLLWASTAAAATSSLCRTLVSTSNASTYSPTAFTPTLNDLIVVLTVASGTVDAGEVTDDQGGTYTKAATGTSAAGVNTMYVFVRNSLAAAAATIVTLDVTGDAATGAILQIYCVAGMTRTGSTGAVLQFDVDSNQSAGTPAPAFASSALTGNPTLGLIANATNPAGLTEPTNWTEGTDQGYATPDTGLESVRRDSGFTGTTITWGGASASAFGAIIVELDTSSASTATSRILGGGVF